jgi:hypothetical protein
MSGQDDSGLTPALWQPANRIRALCKFSPMRESSNVAVLFQSAKDCFSLHSHSGQSQGLQECFAPCTCNATYFSHGRLFDCGDGVKEHARRSRRARRLSSSSGDSDADVDPREESGQCAGAAGNNISPTQHASYYSTALSTFFGPRVVVLLG